MNAGQPQSDKQFGNWGLNPDEQSGDPDGEIDGLLDMIQDYTVQSALGGTPFKTDEENQEDNLKAYDEGRAKAKSRLTRMLREARVDEFNNAQIAMASNDVDYWHNRSEQLKEKS